VRLAKLLCTIQVLLSVLYVIIAITAPDVARDVVLVLLYIVSLGISRYLLWRATRRRNRATST